MNKYIKALELWGKFKMSSLDHEEAVSELATAKAYYESAQASAAWARLRRRTATALWWGY